VPAGGGLVLVVGLGLDVVGPGLGLDVVGPGLGLPTAPVQAVPFRLNEVGLVFVPE
jgi:hypothetical protein